MFSVASLIVILIVAQVEIKKTILLLREAVTLSFWI